MKIMTYNIMQGGREIKKSSNYSRIYKLIEVIRTQNPDVLCMQETELNKENLLVNKLTEYPYQELIDVYKKSSSCGTALLSRFPPSNKKIIGKEVRATQITVNNLKITNIYLDYRNENARLFEIKELLEEEHDIIAGDFNSLSPEDNLNNDIIKNFTTRMKDKYTKDGKIRYDCIEEFLKNNYVDVGLHFHKPKDITDMTDLITGTHSHPVRIDYIFANKKTLPKIKEFKLLNQGTARTASDHFPWIIKI